jgi:hypothetical protein
MMTPMAKTATAMTPAVIKSFLFWCQDFKIALFVISTGKIGLNIFYRNLFSVVNYECARLGAHL